MPQIRPDQADELGRQPWRPWPQGPKESRSPVESLIYAPPPPRGLPNTVPLPADVDTKWAAIRALLAEKGAQNYEALPSDVAEDPANRSVWNGVTGTYMTPAEFIDFKTVAGPTIKRGEPYDPSGSMLLPSEGREVYMRSMPGAIQGAHANYGKSDQAAMDDNFRRRIMALTQQ